MAAIETPTRETILNLGSLQVTRPELEITSDGPLSIEWAPFDFVQQGASLAIVGLTPGRTQAELAIQELRNRLRSGDSWEVGSECAKRHASFGGSMRSNLLKLLDAIELPKQLGMSSASMMFEPSQRAVHYTSVLRYPVFVNGKNYSGSPRVLRHNLLLRFVEDYFFQELKALPQALWLPLGGPAIEVMELAVNRGLVRSGHVLFGLPHPSGANAERIAYFIGTKSAEDCSIKTNTEKLDAQKRQLQAKIAALSYTIPR